MTVRLSKSFTFEAAHSLPGFPDGHKCRRLHGHSFRVDVHVEGPLDPKRGYLIDYGEIKAAFEPLRARLDHYHLNEIEGLENPTSEMIARWIWERLRPALPLLAEVVVHETCDSRCEFRGG
ncbi:6-carboxy-5,6,7,8-tetrahydropterin synthase [Phycisphaerae bacterium RAS1]|nr:6-carboxy-5,6,7,8-tetrahydropterin synthase [Phycisphaerae bacterium RAS1]